MSLLNGVCTHKPITIKLTMSQPNAPSGTNLDIHTVLSEVHNQALSTRVSQVSAYIDTAISSCGSEEERECLTKCRRYLDKDGVSLLDMLVVSYVVNGGIMLKQLTLDPEPDTLKESDKEEFFDPLDTVHTENTSEMDESEIQKLLQELDIVSASTVSGPEEAKHI